VTDDARSPHRFPFVQKAKKENKKERTRTCAKCAAAYCILRFRRKDQEEYQEKKLTMVGEEGDDDQLIGLESIQLQQPLLFALMESVRGETKGGRKAARSHVWSAQTATRRERERERERENSASSWRTYEWSNGHNCSAMQLQQPACNKAM
jgi:hypothetical protein